MKLFEAFSGISTQRMGLDAAGIQYTSVGVSEIDKYAIEACNAIHGETKNYGDISILAIDELPEIDLFTYSFPCQAISVAGRRGGFEQGSGTSSSLLWECKRVIDAKRPQYLLMENVKNLVGKKFFPGFQLWVDYLTSLGYTSYWKVLNAKDYGVPQNRERVYMVSSLDEDFVYDFPEPIPLELSVFDILEEQVEEKYFLPMEFQDKFIRNPQYKTIENKADKKEASLVLAGTILQETWYETMRRVYGVEGLCPTLTTMGGGQREPKILIDGLVRKLTPLECWRVMGFTDEDFWIAKHSGLSNSQLYKLAGNAIVVPVLEAIFRNWFETKPKPPIYTPHLKSTMVAQED